MEKTNGDGEPHGIWRAAWGIMGGIDSLLAHIYSDLGAGVLALSGGLIEKSKTHMKMKTQNHHAPAFSPFLGKKEARARLAARAIPPYPPVVAWLGGLGDSNPKFKSTHRARTRTHQQAGHGA